MRIERILLLVGRHAFLLSALGVRFAWAQDMTGLSLEQLQHVEVVTASKFPQKVSEAPSPRGVELDADHLAPDGSHLKGCIRMQSARNDITGVWLSNSPQTLVKANGSRPLWYSGERIGLETQYTSRRKSVLGGEVGGFTVVNVTLARLQPANRLDLPASIYNVFNKQYADPPGNEHFDNGAPPRYLQSIRQDGRIWRIALHALDYQF